MPVAFNIFRTLSTELRRRVWGRFVSSNAAPMHSRIAPRRPHLCGRAATGALAFALALLLPAAPALASPSHAFTTYFGAASDPYPLSDPTAVAVDNSPGSSQHDVYVTDVGVNEVQDIAVEGRSFGYGTRTMGSNVITEFDPAEGIPFAVGQSVEGAGIPPGTTITAVTPTTIELSAPATESISFGGTNFGAGIHAEARGTYTLSFDGDTTAQLKLTAGSAEVQSALESLPTVGPGNVLVSIGEPPYGGSIETGNITFTGARSHADVSQLEAGSSSIVGGSVLISTSVQGSAGSAVEKFTPSGEFLLIFGRAVNRTKVEAHAPEPEQNLCTAASGDVCQPGTPSSSPGAFETPKYLAVDPTSGDIYVGDTADNLVSKFDSSGVLTSSWGNNGPDEAPNGQLTGFEPPLHGITVDPTGNLFLASKQHVYWYLQGGTLYSSYTDVFDTSSTTFGVDAEDNLYFNQGGRIFKYNNTGKAHAEFGFNDENHEEVDIDSGGPGLAIDLSTNDLYVGTGSEVEHFSFNCGQYCFPLDSFGAGHLSEAQSIALDATSGNAYVANTGEDDVAVFGAAYPLLNTEPASELDLHSATLNGNVDPDGRGEVSSCSFEWGTTTTYSGGTVPCEQATPYSASTAVSAKLTGLSTNTTYHYRLTATNPNGTYYGPDRTFAPSYVLDLSTDPATGVAATTASLNGSLNPNGEEVHYYFEWGTTAAYGHRTVLPPGTYGGSGNGLIHVHFDLTGLDPITTYHYRIVASNAQGISNGTDRELRTSTSVPLVKEHASQVHSESTLLDAEISPGGRPTTYRFEYGPADCSSNPCTRVPAADVGIGAGGSYQSESVHLLGLQPATTYHFRVVATNELGTGGYDTTFTTFPYTAVPPGSCPNPLARQQTGAAFLPDCRAYELVSPANTGGYDVESDLVPGQHPYPGYPQASAAGGASRLLYGIHDGAVPGAAGAPTNKGLDPYLATRGESGWSTEYVGISANDPFAAAPFSSVPTGADATLDTFAFGGPGSCSPCFEGGYTGIPLRLANGKLVQGMVPAPGFSPGPGASPDGYLAQDLSANGEHFVFGSTSRFAAGGNEAGDVSIYDHNLKTGETHVVSNAPSTEDFPVPLPCLQGSGHCNSAENDANGISELAISADGSHILLGQKVATDAHGNVYWHLYMDLGDAVRSIDLTPGTTSGVLYDGMSADGSRVFFTTTDALTTAADQDTDASADLYRAQVSEAGTAALTRISSGESGAGNTDACDPIETFYQPHWNSLGPNSNCDAVAIAGGGGVAATDGTIYFLSPELLQAGHGAANQPNLYLAAPGQPPLFVATLSPNDPLVTAALAEPAIAKSSDFQISPSGRFALFTSSLSLTGYENEGFSEVYRYDAATPQLTCVSCNPTNAGPAGDASLASAGSSLSEDGRVFFNSADALALRATDGRQNVYEWQPQGSGACQAADPTFSEITAGCVGLLSSGQSPFDSSLLSVSADGTDAFFFTHDSLVPQDENGPVTKIYDARTDGGFFVIPPPPPCAASDECHGPGSQAPGPPAIRTPAGSPETYVPPGHSKCRAGYVKKHGRCVKKPKSHKHDRTHHRSGHPRGGPR